MPLRRRLTRAAICTAATTAALAITSPAWALSTVPLNPAHVGATAGKFQQECKDPKFGTRPANQDGWHFVLPTNKAGDFRSLTLTFTDTGGASVRVTVPDPTDPYTDFLSANGNGDKQVKHAYLFTPTGWTLTGGSAQVSGEGDKFNLSHTCAGTGSTGSPTPTPTTGSPTPSGPPTESTPPGGSPSTSGSAGGGGGGGDNGGSLPITGAAAASTALAGLALIGGGALLMMRRRRDRITFTS
ncbi:LPXTG cell wall anchor domain-containing protein [Micromonospora foliorum]|uniref:LPXTG cell wall anchor domain-containing protein n=1 Tax=Micromonospora foliorum TaxID=2911210 RepID=UPI001EE7E135|nr:LPXTG cell wall anchor domain-containing protein [Micromonospora foliorum]MCG5440259.1 LPXTG cell wall anchor domain-containing protein [Micromonospora foliorum]